MDLSSTTASYTGPYPYEINVKSEHRDGNTAVSYVRFMEARMCGVDVKFEHDPAAEQYAAVPAIVTVSF